ncbi:battenin CLN3 family protein [Schizosaccharomyces cryophilus OY26]|uniref:Protein BTN n=1 Tax=Schizosaccharomyces cryophilus (strain OY26 / ATCC MYA-4695 / CBS 11777 / NBRC 106824 / NRRL Y48691) TaxID=653667 RepID=S9X3Q1_SCHCR|nr:battenin CLN3 family protein [Schizosaccharomyces cryophilus OY26]EPY51727.1 battenin CLN3 family protein [Schizosaccharomyces cryophilus OY26]
MSKHIQPMSSTYFPKGSKVGFSFLIFGLLNNLLYVVILSAALDLVGANISKGVVLLSNIVPSLSCKLFAPILQVHKYSASKRLLFCAFLSFFGMQWITWSSSVSSRMLGVALAAVSSSFGEITFLQLSSRYQSTALTCWSSGTGLAGLFGASFYLVFTTWFNFTVRTTLLISSFLPLFLIFNYFFILPTAEYQHISVSHQVPFDAIHRGETSSPTNVLSSMRVFFYLAKPFFLSHMLPLFLVYLSEYTINVGVAPTLLFSQEDSGLSSFRDFYPTYQTMYQLGVFISRSSIGWVKVPYVLELAIIQFGILGFTILQSLFYFIHSYHFLLLIIFMEGLIGGTVYVNVYHTLQNLGHVDSEMAISIVSPSDSTGIFVASLLSLILEPTLCGYQVRHGRDWCNRI